MKDMLVKGSLAAGMLLALSGCETAYTRVNEVRLVAEPFVFRSRDDLLLEQRKCINTHALLADCSTSANTGFRLQDNVRENVYDNLSDKLFAGSSRSGKKSRFRLKKDRLEWQYKF